MLPKVSYNDGVLVVLVNDEALLSLSRGDIRGLSKGT